MDVKKQHRLRQMVLFLFPYRENNNLPLPDFIKEQNPSNMRHISRLLVLFAVTLFSSNISAVTENTSVYGDHGKLDVKIQMPDGYAADSGKKLPLFILCHGFSANKEGWLFDVIADSLLSNGIAVLRFDFNGHGKSEGAFENMTVPNEIEDTKHILRFASSLPWVGKIALGGHSQGGVVAAMTSGQLSSHPEKDIKKISALVLLAPAAVLRDDALRGNTFGKTYDPKNPPSKIDLWGGMCLGRDFVRTAVELPIYETAKAYKRPECIIHGDADRIVPYTYGQRFHYLNKKSEWHLLVDADHGFGGQENVCGAIVRSFLCKAVK